MQQAELSLPRLFENYQAADAEKRRVYAMAEQAADDDIGAAEVACYAAHDTAEAVADAILAWPARSPIEFAIKARVLLARGSDPVDLFHYRPEDLARFLREVCSFAG
ncbi:hypothetical protein [Bradyrhizobium zhanjiangense]|nr:hypothetical protein [Bradyrhizobium zhanjiangense]